MSISLTNHAADHVKRFLAGNNGGHFLRLRVKTTGCSGYSYVVEAEHTVGPDDTLFESNGVQILVDANSLQFLDGTEVDYGREGLNAAFQFANPNVKNTCGCGESFNV